jgi:flagellar protein FliO/FliZ
MKSLTLTRGVALFGALMLWPAATAAAASSTGTGENTPLGPVGHTTVSHAASGGASIVRTIAGLFIVIAVIYGIAWILRQAKKGKSRPTGNGLSQVASLPLGSGRSVTVVRAGREVIVVGVAENGVTPLRTYSEEEALALGIDVPPAEEPSAPAGSGTPSGRMLDALRRMTVRS